MDNNEQKIIFFECDYVFDRDHLTLMFKNTCSKLLKMTNVIKYISGPLLLICAAVIIALNAVSNLSSYTFIYLSGIYIFMALYDILTLPGVRARLMINKITNGRGSMRCRNTFDSDMMTLCDDTGKKTAYSYNYITDFGEDTEAFNMMLGRKAVLRIPKNSFIYGNPAQFSAFIREKMSKENKINVMALIGNIMAIVLICLALFLILMLFMSILSKFLGPIDFANLHSIA